MGQSHGARGPRTIDDPKAPGAGLREAEQIRFDEEGTVRGVSLDAQVAAVDRVPALAGCPREIFIDANRSRRETSKREGFKEMTQQRIPSGGVGAVFFDKPDRIGRNVVEFYRFMELCEQHRVLVFDSSGLVRGDDPASWGIKAVLADDELRRMANRTRDSLHELQEQGRLLGHAPLGYRVEGKKNRRHLVPDIEAAAVVKETFAHYSSGRFSVVSLAAI